MRVAISFTRHDADQFHRWLDWTSILRGTERHDLFVMPAKGLPPLSTQENWALAWNSVTIVPDYEGVVSEWSGNSKVRDASGPNSSFRQFARYFHYENQSAFLWMEPDAIPLVSDWLDRIEAEYQRCGKRFMGAVVDVPNVPKHCSGIGVYDQNTALCTGLMQRGTSRMERQIVEIAFDVAGANEMLSNHHATPLIQHVFRGPEFPSALDLARISPQAVVWHTSKDGSLVQRLRERLSVVPVQAESKGLTEISGASPTPQDEARESTHLGRVEMQAEGHSRGDGISLPRVHTYFAPVPLMDEAEQLAMLEIWKQAWSAQGWEPVILGPGDVPYDEAEQRAFRAMPSVNSVEYEMACYNRHLAMRKLGGLLTDYDVLPRDFKPIEVHGMWRLRLYDGHVPCVVFGSREEYARIVTRMLATPPEGTHWSDMLAMQKLSGEYATGSECVEYGKSGWETAQLVHFSHHACNGKDRLGLMREFLHERMASSFDTCVTTPSISQLVIEERARQNERDARALMNANILTSLSSFETQTVAGQTNKEWVRGLVRQLAKFAEDKAGRKVLVQQIIREEGLFGPKKKRKPRLTPMQEVDKLIRESKRAKAA